VEATDTATTETATEKTVVENESTPENTGEVASVIKTAFSEAPPMETVEKAETHEKPMAEEAPAEAEASPPSPPRRGWWQRVIS
jgi:hypothetical protein